MPNPNSIPNPNADKLYHLIVRCVTVRMRNYLQPRPMLLMAQAWCCCSGNVSSKEDLFAGPRAEHKSQGNLVLETQTKPSAVNHKSCSGGNWKMCLVFVPQSSKSWRQPQDPEARRIVLCLLPQFGSPRSLPKLFALRAAYCAGASLINSARNTLCSFELRRGAYKTRNTYRYFEYVEKSLGNAFCN